MINIDQHIDEHLQTVVATRDELKSFCAQVVKICLDCWQQQGHVYVAGNGGSAADATHIVGELVGRLRTDRRPLRATCLGADFATLTAVSNDYGYEQIFAREIRGKARANDVFWAISTSGNSGNILAAIQAAREIGGVKVIGMSGKTGGKMKALCDLCLCVPHTFSGRIQEVHELAYHIICDGIEQAVLQQK